MTRLLAALEWHLLINNPVRAISTWYILNLTKEVDHRANFLMRDYCRKNQLTPRSQRCKRFHEQKRGGGA